MPLSDAKKESIKAIIKKSLRDKFEKYSPETKYMPFHTKLLGKDRLALYSFIHSLSTNFGTTIFEPVAVSLAKDRFREVDRSRQAKRKISEAAQNEIQKIIDGLTIGNNDSDKKTEVERIRELCQDTPIHEVKLTNIDIYLRDENDEIYLIDLKTAKPNKGAFKEFKRTLLEWVAVELFENPESKVNTLIAIPYNPYHPKPYERWTMRGMLDLDAELKVAEEFWNFVGGDGIYEELLDCFATVGDEMRDEIDRYFENFN